MRWCLSVFDRDHRISQSSLLQTPRLAGFFYFTMTPARYCAGLRQGLIQQVYQ